jgi:hypothetical protein
MTDIAFSSTVKASALKKIITTSSKATCFVAVAQERAQFAHHRIALPGNDELQIFGERGQQARLVQQMRQRDQHQDQQRDERQQRVIRDAAG